VIEIFEQKFRPFKVHSGNVYYDRDISIPSYFHPELPYIFRALMFKENLNMNSFVLEVGNPRTSKSYCAMTIAENLERLRGKKFDVEKQLTFDDIKKFLNWSKDATDSIFILDETGTTLSPDQFWSLQQRVMRRFVQTQGFRKNVLIWVLPSVVFIQKGFRFMANYAIKTKKQGVVDVYKIVVDQLIGKGYPDYIETMHFNMPSAETIEIYERMKKEWNDVTLENDIDFMKDMEKPFEKPIPVSIIMSKLKDGKIPKEDAIFYLEQNGFSYNNAQLMVS
jgi:hypothetical protein